VTNNSIPRSGKAFTITFRGRANVIPLDVGISLPFPETRIVIGDPRIKRVKAILDTGATGSVITKNISKALDLKPISLSRVHHFGGIAEDVNVYLVSFYLPNAVRIKYTKVTECDGLIGSFDALIGMDLITLGDLAITNRDGRTIVSYQYSSLNQIDFVRNSILSPP